MAFPGTYNINYYSGDTLELQFFPVDANGDEFDLSGYSAAMVVATERGTAGLIKASLASPSNGISVGTNPNAIYITLKKSNSDLPAGTYVYDLQITKEAAVYTLVTGTFSVTSDVTGSAH